MRLLARLSKKTNEGGEIISVLRSKRRISPKEYERSFSVLYEYTTQRTAKLPLRQKKWIGESIDSVINGAFEDILSISNVYVKNEQRPESVRFFAGRAITKLVSLRKPLLVMWNVQKFETRRMVHWVKLISNEIDLLRGLPETQEEALDEIDLPIIDWDYVNGAEFVKNLCELHRILHGKVIHVPNAYDSSVSRLIIDLIDDALFSVVMANRRIPKTRQEAEERRKYLSKAVSDLTNLNIPLTSLFNIMHYSEAVQKDIADRLYTEILLLKGLLKSDHGRFKDLA